MKQQHDDMLKRICAWIFIVLSILASFSCADLHSSNPGSNNSGGSNVVRFSTALPPSTVLTCPSDSSEGPFVAKNGTQLVYQGVPLKLYGYTFYPSLIGWSAAWRRADFTHYIDSILDIGRQAGQNLVRPTDFWDKNYHDQQQDDVTIWKNMDYLVCAAKQRGMFVVLDVSAFAWFLVSQGHDPYDSGNWITFLDAVGKHYSNQSSIAFYSILGEPSPPKTVGEMNHLVDFYRVVTDELNKADGHHHLITAGGFNHMEDETPQTPWWQRIYALPNNDIMAFKTYSQDDLHLISTISAFAKTLGKPLVDEEFGLPQRLGDATSSGEIYNNIRTSRAQFYKDVYGIGQANGVSGFVFWNMGFEIAAGSYEVSPKTPAVWHVIQTSSNNAR